MLEFHKLTMDDREQMTRIFRSTGFPSAKYTFAGNYVWRDIYRMEVAYPAGMVTLKMQSEDMPELAFQCPAGSGDLIAAVEEVHEYAKANGLTTRLQTVYPEQKKLLEAAFGDRIRLEEDRDYSDYVYERESLATLSGKRLHGKRNHISRFNDIPWHYESLSRDNLAEVIEMHMIWCMDNGTCEGHSGEWRDTCASMQALTRFEELGMRGGVVFQQDKVVAYALGEPINDQAFVVHFEKAFPQINGAYTVINQQFVLHETEGFRLVNREEDTGEEGLRKAKLSYQPLEILTEYQGVLKD